MLNLHKLIHPSASRTPIRGWLISIFLIGLALRIAYVTPRWQSLPQWNVDAIGYHQLAVNTLAGRGFSLNTEAPFRHDSIRTPGYPLFLSAIYLITGIQPRAAILVQCAIDAFTAVMAGWLAWQLTRRRPALILAGLCYATDTVAWRYSAELYVEVVQGAALIGLGCLIVGNTFLTKRPILHAIALGLASGILVLIKPNLLPLPLIVAAYALWRMRAWRPVLALLLSSALVLLPWCIRNQLVFGRFTVSTVFENNVLVVSAPATLVEAHHEDTLPWTPRWMFHFNAVVDRAMQAHPALLTLPEARMTDLQRGEASALLASAAQEVLRENPVAFVSGHLKGVLRGLPSTEHQFWFQALSGKPWDVAVPKGMLQTILGGDLGTVSRLAMAVWAYFAVRQMIGLIGLAAGALWLWRTQRAFLVWSAVLIAYVVVLPGPILYERFTLPIVPILGVLIGCGGQHVFVTLMSRKVPTLTSN